MILSVIIPTFKNNIELSLLLHELKTYSKHIEIIVIDDDVNSSALSVCDSFSFVKYYLNKHNKGAGGARNFGLSLASGKYVTFIDSDDKITDKFSVMLDDITKETYDVFFYRPQAIMAGTNLTSKRALKYQKLVDDYPKKSFELKLSWYVPWSKVILRKFLIKNNIFFEEVSHSNDVLFSTKVGLLMKTYLVKKISFYIVTENSRGLTKETTSNSIITRIKEVEKYNNYISQSGYSNYMITPYSLYIKLLKKPSFSNIFFIIKFLFSSKTPLIDKRIFNFLK
uniref:WpaJ n=1 Tax=Providencia alcalifaciens TaxID=126385 RepID=M9P0U6_9GAMM|nr:WpaJ [Providencia alcalifaciens]